MEPRASTSNLGNRLLTSNLTQSSKWLMPMGGAAPCWGLFDSGELDPVFLRSYHGDNLLFQKHQEPTSVWHPPLHPFSHSLTQHTPVCAGSWSGVWGHRGETDSSWELVKEMRHVPQERSWCSVMGTQRWKNPPPT